MSWINSRIAIFLGLIIVISINEFTLAILDKNPPLSASAIQKIRIFDLVVLLLAFSHRNIFTSPLHTLKAMSKFTTSYLVPVLISLLALDFAIGLTGFGYQSHYNQENIERYPTPADTFRGKPNVRDHNSLGFRGEFSDRADSYNVAIFGGSTTYHGNPPIINLVANELKDQGISIDAFNFGSVSSNHSQHVHRLLEFSDRYRFDLVIFFGGVNESLQYASYDPRPGYPYNFFFRNELAQWKQTLLRISSILGTIDIYTGGLISGLRSLRATEIDAQWTDEIAINYWRDLGLANSISRALVKPDLCVSTNFLSVLQPANPSAGLETDLWNSLMLSQSERESSLDWSHLDFSYLQPMMQFTDIAHVTQQSNELIAVHLAREVGRILSTNCG